MFFYIGAACPVKSMKQVEPRLFLDEGWNQKSGIWYKGYSTECVLEDSIYDIVNGYQPAGKWCVICNGEVYHPVLRGFPHLRKGDEQTNLPLPDFELVRYLNPDINLDFDNETVEEVSLKIGDILVENTKNFYKYNDPNDMTVILSGGLDTLTCWVIQEQVNPKFNLTMHIPTEKDTTLSEYVGIHREYESDLMDLLPQTYWGYVPCSLYKPLNWTNSGYYTETYTYRDITALAGFMKYTGATTVEQMVKETDYYNHFLSRPDVKQNVNQFLKKVNVTDELSLRRYLWSTIWYDHQIWHIDNNMFFCPFADIRIPELAMRLSIDDMIRIAVNGDIQRNIIKRFKPEVLSLLADFKNERLVWKNFVANFNESMVHPDTKIIYR